LAPNGDSEEGHEHIAVEREPEAEFDRRTRRPPPPQFPQRQPADHGSNLEDEYSETLRQTAERRAASGVDPSRLIVIALRSYEFSVRDLLEGKLRAYVVDEGRSTDDDLARVVVQFTDDEAAEVFHRELRTYREGNLEASAALTVKQRESLFGMIEDVRSIGPEERRGERLRAEGLPAEEPFFLDVDLWHPGTVDEARFVTQQVRELCLRRGGRVTGETRTASLLLLKVESTRPLANDLLNLDWVAKLDLPPRIREASFSALRDEVPRTPPPPPSGDEGLVCVIDSGVIPGHPLLQGWVTGSRDFDSGEGTEFDVNGHGTCVAGIAAYGDVGAQIDRGAWLPTAKICSAKILRHDPILDRAAFPEGNRIEATVEQAIRYFHEEQGCRVFNLSIGIEDHVYRGQKQFALAEKLDELARELDVVIVVPTGNRSDPPVPEGARTREQFQEAVRNQLATDAEQRVLDPATASCALTVGAIAGSAECRTRDAFACAPEGAPPAFSRVGPGLSGSAASGAIKPELVAPGGSFALQVIAGGPPRWVERDPYLGEPTLRPESEDGRFLTTVSATSFAAPRIANFAARAEVALRAALGEVPSANLIRAVIASSAELPPCGSTWLLDADRKETDKKLRLVGYGSPDVDRTLSSYGWNACLVADDRVEEDKFHVYEVPVPESFLEVRGARGLTVAIAHDPPLRASRRDYLSRTMWVEAIKGLSLDDVRRLRAKHDGEGDPEKLPQSKLLPLRPARTAAHWSTLQVRRIRWTRRPKLINEAGKPVLHVLVGCQRRFDSGLHPSQRYGLVVRFWHEGERLDLRLYDELRASSRVRAIVRARVEAQRT